MDSNVEKFQSLGDNLLLLVDIETVNIGWQIISAEEPKQDFSGKLKSSTLNSELLLGKINNLIKTDNECNIHIETDQNGIFLYLLTQIKMKLLTKQFFSVLCINATYKVNIEGFPLYTI
jgi:hypothetical protein